MKRFVVLVSLLALLGAGFGCSKAAKTEENAIASDAATAAKNAAQTVADQAKKAADKAASVINDKDVEIKDFEFRPGTRTVGIGTEVTWLNHGNVEHTVTANNKSFDSGHIKSAKEFSFRFTQSGTYAYHCEIHPALMKGTIVVR